MTSISSNLGFVTREYQIIPALVLLILTIGFVDSGELRKKCDGVIAISNAKTLVESVDTYAAETGAQSLKGLGNVAVKPMTVERANEIYKKISECQKVKGILMRNGVLSSEMNLPVNTKFPHGWGETTVGHFDPLPSFN